MTQEELFILNQEGLIPGPRETREQFEERVRAVQEQMTSQLPSSYWEWPTLQLSRLFDVSPRWCPVLLSSKGLAPWQGAVTWVDVKRFYTIQLNPKRWVRALIDPEELLAHEAVHAARAAFEEPRYEEIFAYLSSGAKWRRMIGAIFQTPTETYVWLALLVMGAALGWLEIFFNQLFFSAGCFLAAFALLFSWSMRLFVRKRRLTRALVHVHSSLKLTLHTQTAREAPCVRKVSLKDPSKALAVLFRLTDTEIEALAREEPLQEQEELRWQIIKTVYLKEV